jgi:hypothetical protein
MQVKLNSQEIDFLKDVLRDTEFFDLTLEFEADQNNYIDDDIADEIRDICADEEVSEVNKAAVLDIIITDRGIVAADLVDKLIQFDV